MVTKSKLLVFGAGVLGLVALSGASNATVIIVHPNGAPSFTGDSNIIFNGCGGGEVLGPAAIVTGCLNDNHSALFDFTGNENLEILGGGQARVDDEGEDGFQFMEVTAQAGGFASFITNIMVTNHAVGQPQVGQVEITPYIGGIAQAASTFDVTEAGNNWFGIYTDNADVFSSIEFQILNFGDTGVEFDDFRQNRVGLAADDGGPGPGPGEVPAPGMAGLLGLGLLGLGLFRRRRGI